MRTDPTNRTALMSRTTRRNKTTRRGSNPAPGFLRLYATILRPSYDLVAIFTSFLQVFYKFSTSFLQVQSGHKESSSLCSVCRQDRESRNAWTGIFIYFCPCHDKTTGLSKCQPFWEKRLPLERRVAVIGQRLKGGDPQTVISITSSTRHVNTHRKQQAPALVGLSAGTHCRRTSMRNPCVPARS